MSAPFFDKASIKRWRRGCHQECDWILGEKDDPAFRRAALVVMSIYAFGTDVDTLAAISGQTPVFVRETLKRLRAQRVLSGQRLRVNWDDDKLGLFSVCLDVMVATGELARPVDPKRSAALKGKAGRKRGGANKPKPPLLTGAVYTPQVCPVPKQLYGLSEWETTR